MNARITLFLFFLFFAAARSRLHEQKVADKDDERLIEENYKIHPNIEFVSVLKNENQTTNETIEPTTQQAANISNTTTTQNATRPSYSTSIQNTTRPSNTINTTQIQNTTIPSYVTNFTTIQITTRPSNTTNSTTIQNTTRPSYTTNSTIQNTTRPLYTTNTTSIQNTTNSTTIRNTTRPSYTTNCTTIQITTKPSNTTNFTTVQNTTRPSNVSYSTTVEATAKHPNTTNSTTVEITTRHPNILNSTTVEITTRHPNVSNSTTVKATTRHPNVSNSTTVENTTRPSNTTNSSTNSTTLETTTRPSNITNSTTEIQTTTRHPNVSNSTTIQNTTRPSYTIPLQNTTRPSYTTNTTTIQNTTRPSNTTNSTTEIQTTTRPSNITNSTTEIQTTTRQTTEAPNCKTDPELCAATEYCKQTEDDVHKCVCLPGYSKADSLNGTCTKVKQFGGQLVFYSSSIVYKVKTSTNTEQNLELEVEKFLDETYKNTSSYDHSDVVCASQSTGYLCDYVTVFEADEFESNGLDQATIEKTVEDEISELCTYSSCEIGGEKLNQIESVNKVGVIADASKLCGDSCDASSTYCDVISDGDYICVCKEKFVPIDGTKATCAKKLCTIDYDCNDPFGTCNSDADNEVGACECMTLFNGENCEDPWLFILVIVLGFEVWIGLVVLFWWCCSSRNNNKETNNEIEFGNLSRKPSLINYGYTNTQSLNDIPDTGLRAQLPPLVVNQQQNGGYNNSAYSGF